MANVKVYGSVNGEAKEIVNFYGSVDGKSKEIKKVYGSVNDLTKLVWEKSGMDGAYAILYTPGNPDMDWVDDAESVRMVLNGSSYWQNPNSHTHLKFTEKCKELTSITAIGNNVSLTEKVKVIEGMENLTSVTSIGNSFLYNDRIRTTVTSISELPPNLLSIGDNFLMLCTVFDSAIVIPESVTSIGASFMYDCIAFNSPIALPNNLNSLGRNFLYECRKFNQPLTISGQLTRLNDGFLKSCSGFNSAITFDAPIGVLGIDFMYSCSSFNQPLTLPESLSVISAYFMYSCAAFNQPLTIPGAVDNMAGFFMYGANNFVGPLTVNHLPDALPSDTTEILSTPNSSAPMYTTGVTIDGDAAQEWKKAFPDRTSSPYRKLVVESSWDPTNPTLDGLQAAVNAGEYIEPGTEIPDTWNGQSAPLVVAHNLNSTNNSAYGGAEGVILMRKYALDTPMRYAAQEVYPYDTCTIPQYLDGEYLDKCSPELRGMISDLTVSYMGYYGVIRQRTNKWNLISGVEACGTYNSGEGVMWDIWKQRTGLSSPDNGNNSGRMVTRSNGKAVKWWIRSMINDYIGYVAEGGNFPPGGTIASFEYYVLPFCFIAKSGNHSGGGSDN